MRIVRIEDVDTCACCGTHVHRTGSVGQIKVIGVQKYKSGVRVSILCGRRALEEENAVQEQAKKAGNTLSVPISELSGAVERMLGERDSLRAQNDALGMRVFSLMAQGEMDKAVRVAACDVLPASQARKLRHACRRRNGRHLCFCRARKDGALRFLLRRRISALRPVRSAKRSAGAAAVRRT